MKTEHPLTVSYRRTDRLLFVLLLVIAIGVPLALQVYGRASLDNRIAIDAKVFTLTGHVDKGWIPGEVKAWQALTFHGKNLDLIQPVLRVTKGDRVVLKLTSSDVIHGFSLIDFGINITDGVLPGKIKLVSFIADKVGTFTFTCNAICGDKHQEMKGFIIVKA